MGYYTDFELEFDHSGKTSKEEKFVQECKEKGLEVPKGMLTNKASFFSEVIGCLNKISGYDFTHGSIGEVKWYDWETHMKALSREYPDVLFTLSGDGEENGDLWKAYFKNGKCQYEKAKITFDAFDENKLK